MHQSWDQSCLKILRTVSSPQEYSPTGLNKLAGTSANIESWESSGILRNPQESCRNLWGTIKTSFIFTSLLFHSYFIALSFLFHCYFIFTSLLFHSHFYFISISLQFQSLPWGYFFVISFFLGIPHPWQLHRLPVRQRHISSTTVYCQ